MARPEIMLFGDESTAPEIVTYGLIAFSERDHVRNARYAWQKVLKKYGGTSQSKIHARELFSGQARKKTDWSHLSEQESAQLSIDLTAAIKSERASFSLGVVHTSTYPAQGIPDGLDIEGNQKYNPLETPLFYGFGFIAAAAGLGPFQEAIKRGAAYRLNCDPITNAVKLFSDWKATQVVKLFESSGMKPTPYIEKPQLLDAADLFAYAGARARSKHPARNKATCQKIFEITDSKITDFWWNVDGQTSPPT